MTIGYFSNCGKIHIAYSYHLSHFGCSSVVSSIFVSLYHRAPELFSICKTGTARINQLPIPLSSQTLASTPLPSVSGNSTSLGPSQKWNHTVLSSGDWVLSLDVMCSRHPCCGVRPKCPSLRTRSNIPLYIRITCRFLSTPPSMCTWIALTLGYYE